MQERDFIPAIGMNRKSFWKQVKALARKHEADEILMYMWLMLEKANAAQVEVRQNNFVSYGRNLKLFSGVTDWFPRMNAYGRAGGLRVTHHVISSGIREMISGTPIKSHFTDFYGSSYLYNYQG